MTKIQLDAPLARFTDDYWRLSAARLLAKSLAAIRRERGLGDGFEHTIWTALETAEPATNTNPSFSIQTAPAPPSLTANERHLLLGLSEACGGWVRWCASTPRHPLGDEHLSGAEWVSMAEWLAARAA